MFSVSAKIQTPDCPAPSLVTVQTMLSQLQLLRLEIIYPELKLKCCIMAVPCICYASGSDIDQAAR